MKDKYFIPSFVINQNFTVESLKFFVTLWYVLGKTASLSINENKNNKLVIRLSSESWDTILNSYANYFSSIYGEKHIAFQKLLLIRHLTSKNNMIDTQSLATAIHLMYDISLYGVNRKLSLIDQLKKLSLQNIKANMPNFIDNFTPISIPFVIGFILGDGTLHVRLRMSDKGSIWIIPIVLLPQLNNKYNNHFFILLTKFFESLDIKPQITNDLSDLEKLGITNTLPSIEDSIEDRGKKELYKMTFFTIEGIHNVFDKFVPSISSYSHHLYWKYHQYELMLIVSRFMKGNAHKTLYGFITIIETIYTFPNIRIHSKYFWLNIIKCWFLNQAKNMTSGENNIQAVFGRELYKGKVIAWKCVLPKYYNTKNKQFGFTNSAESEKALKQAIQYRDNAIKSWVDSLK